MAASTPGSAAPALKTSSTLSLSHPEGWLTQIYSDPEDVRRKWIEAKSVHRKNKNMKHAKWSLCVW